MMVNDMNELFFFGVDQIKMPRLTQLVYRIRCIVFVHFRPEDHKFRWIYSEIQISHIANYVFLILWCFSKWHSFSNLNPSFEIPFYIIYLYQLRILHHRWNSLLFSHMERINNSEWALWSLYFCFLIFSLRSRNFCFISIVWISYNIFFFPYCAI